MFAKKAGVGSHLRCLKPKYFPHLIGLLQIIQNCLQLSPFLLCYSWSAQNTAISFDYARRLTSVAWRRKPRMLSLLVMLRKNGSTCKQKSSDERGHPWRTESCTLMRSPTVLLTISHVLHFQYLYALIWTEAHQEVFYRKLFLNKVVAYVATFQHTSGLMIVS